MSRKTLLGLALGATIALLAVPAPASAQQCTNPPDDFQDCAPAAHGDPIPFTGDTGPARVRKSAWDMTPDEVAKYKQAWQALRDLSAKNPDDPRGWAAQARVHCWQCGGGIDGKQGEEIHDSWLFFPWHRAYLYFLEKILGSVSNDPTLALPYWDWNDPAHTTLPPPFDTPNDASNPLFNPLRGVIPTDRLTPSEVGPAVMNQVMSARNWITFMGSPNGPNSNGGSVENGPHGTVHLWTGQPSMDLPCGGPDMGILATAAKDPVFFSHHANIDRLWDVWLQAARTHTNPPYKSWLDHEFYFFDEKSQWRSIKISDVVNHEKSLHYTYAGATQPTVAAAVSATEAAPPRAAASAPAAAPVRLTAEPKTVTASAVPTEALDPGPGAQLHIEGIQVPASRAAYVRVFVGNPQATAETSTEDPSFLGYFTVVPKGGKGHQHDHGKKKVILEIPEALAEKLGNLSEAQVTLVPVSQGKAKPRSVELTFDRIYITP